MIARAGSFLTRHVALVIIVLSALACLAPGLFSWATSYTSVFLGVIMFGMGLTIKPADFKVVFSHPKEVVLGALLQYTVMPLLAWALVTLLELPQDLAVGVILVACCPGGTASNVITYIAKGDVPLSVGMTIVSTLIAPLVTPVLVYALAGAWVEVSLPVMFISVIRVVLVPVVAGVLLAALVGERIERVSAALPVISVVAIALIVAGIMAANVQKLAGQGLVVLGVVALHNGFGMLIGYLVSRLFGLDYPKVTAVALEVGMQNSGLAVTLATGNFAQLALATLPGAIFSIWQNIAGSLFANARVLHMPADVAGKQPGRER